MVVEDEEGEGGESKALRSESVKLGKKSISQFSIVASDFASVFKAVEEGRGRMNVVRPNDVASERREERVSVLSRSLSSYPPTHSNPSTHQSTFSQP